MVTFESLVKKLEEAYAEEKKKECEDLYNALVDVLVMKKATIQNTLFTLRMIEWGYLRAKYEELVEGNVAIPEGSVPVPRGKKK